MNRTPFSRAENSSGRASATPLLNAPGPTTRLASSIWMGANALPRSGLARPASSAVIVPARMSVLSPSMRKHTAPLARDRPPPECVPLIRAKRTWLSMRNCRVAGQFSAQARTTSRSL